MNGILKIVTALLGIIAVIACLGTVAIIGYSLSGGEFKNKGKDKEPSVIEVSLGDNEDTPSVTAVPTEEPSADPTVTAVPLSLSPEHVHDYKPNVLKKASCLESGQVEYICMCGDSYVIDQLATGHVPDEEWIVLAEPTAKNDGARVKKCIYCDEILIRETLPATGGNNGNGVPSGHQHLYVATTEREATCTLSGLRKHTCSCGDFYTDSIPAIGHVAENWTETEAPEVGVYGTSERRCSVCGALLDIRKIPALTPTPNPSPSASASASASSSPSASAGATATPTPTAAPTPTPHVHKYSAYVVTPANCTERGIRSYVCSCGDSYAESIELDLNNHSYYATFVAPTDTQQGYTVYTCTRCNYSYKDNYLLPLTNNAPAEDEESAE